MRYFYFLITFLFFTATSVQAQSWRQLSKEAAQSVRLGKFAQAAEQYEAAWKAKEKKTEFIAKAGELYANVRDYKRSAEAYRNIKDNKSFPLAKYYFARALKQDGQYTEASREFSEFINMYSGAKKESLSSTVQNEIKGCELAQQILKDNKKPTIQFSRLIGQVNSAEADFAPIPFADDIIYFSSTISGKAVIYRSQKNAGSWSRAVVPTGIPENKEKSVCNGSFSADGKRFYYTECGSNIGRLEATCQIYVIIKQASGWSLPIKLREAINVVGANVTQPFSTQLGEKEILYYASDAEGGNGGMDIWVATRNINAGDLDFATPINLGAMVNSSGDEITPHYDASEDILYFSSNGQVALGGFDIFKTKGSEKTWTKPENAGTPLNSSADDYYFAKNKSKNGGFLVSNRTFGKEKAITTNEDLFEFSNLNKVLAIKGQTLEKDNSSAIKDVRITLYEVMNNSQKRLLQTKSNPESDYEFALLPEKKYRVETEKKGYKLTFYEFSTAKAEGNTEGIMRNLYLEKQDKNTGSSATTYIEDANAKKNPTPTPTNNLPKTTTTPPTKVTTTPNVNVATTPTTIPKVTPTPNVTATPTPTTQPNSTSTVATNSNKSNSSTPPILTAKDGQTATTTPSTTREKGTSVGVLPLYETAGPNSEKLLTSAPKQKGISYKIQVLATKDFSIDEPRYRPIRDLGRLDTEYIIGKGLNRVLVADFFDYEEAVALLPQIQQNKEFKSAYIVKYQDGIRVGTGK
jgi:tetratricopeptide (TPR) repeat protein